MKQTANLIDSGSSCTSEFDSHMTLKRGGVIVSDATLLLFSGENPVYVIIWSLTYMHDMPIHDIWSLTYMYVHDIWSLTYSTHQGQLNKCTRVMYITHMSHASSSVYRTHSTHVCACSTFTQGSTNSHGKT